VLSADIKTTLAALRARPEVAGEIGAFGYCMGGRLAYQAAAQGGLAAAVSFYGGSIHHQLDIASDIRCPMQFHNGALDTLISAEAVARIKAAFAGKAAEFHLYEDAGHGFNCWARAAYHQPSSALAHARTLLHFATHLR
jgi:carboxymethylenebutenolidase